MIVNVVSESVTVVECSVATGPDKQRTDKR